MFVYHINKGSPQYIINRTVSSADEGSSIAFTLFTQYVAIGTHVPYTITGVTSGDIGGAPLTGNFIVGSQTTVTLSITADTVTEGLETLTLSLDNYPGVTTTVDINDTSTADAYWARQVTSAESDTRGTVSDSTGNVYTCGTYTLSGVATGFVMKLNLQGDVIWKRSVATTNGQQVLLNSIALDDGAGSVYVAGHAFNTPDICAFKYSAETGSLVWQRKISTGSGTSDANGTITVSKDGSSSVILSGYSYQGTTLATDIIVVKLDPVTGATMWYKTYGSSGFDICWTLDTDTSGNIYIGYESQYGGNTLGLLKLTSSGAQSFNRQVMVNIGTSTLGTAVGTDCVYIGGPWKVSNTVYNMIVCKYALDGTLAWQRIFGDATGTQTVVALAVDSQNNLYVLGRSFTSATGYDTIIVKYDSTGAVQWQRDLTSAISLIPYSISVDPSGKLVIGCKSFVVRLPADGTHTGTAGVLTYGQSAHTAATASLGSSTTALTLSTGSFAITNTAGALNESAWSTLQSTIVVL